MKNLNEISKRVLTIKKTFNVPRKSVWEAWTDPEHIVQWWAPKGMKIKVVQLNLKWVAIGSTPCRCQTVVNSFLKVFTRKLSYMRKLRLRPTLDR